MANPLNSFDENPRLLNMSSVHDHGERHCAGLRALPLNAVVCRYQASLAAVFMRAAEEQISSNLGP
jgi:hypothetical protein